MDAMVQIMRDTDDFHCILQSMNKDADWCCGKVWKLWKIIQEHYQSKDSTSARGLASALHRIKLKKKNTNPMTILSAISAVEVRFKKTLNEERKIKVMLGCAQVIVTADRIAQIKSGGTPNATVLELCKAKKKMWQIAGHNNDNKEEDDDDDDSKWLETLLGAVKQKQSSGYQKCFHCNKRGHRSLHCCDKKKKGRSEKAGAVAETSIKKTRPKCSHCGGTITLRATAGRNTHTRPQARVQWKLQEHSWRKNYLCATLNLMTHTIVRHREHKECILLCPYHRGQTMGGS
jgi:hypothetical protein